MLTPITRPFTRRKPLQGKPLQAPEHHAIEAGIPASLDLQDLEFINKKAKKQTIERGIYSPEAPKPLNIDDDIQQNWLLAWGLPLLFTILTLACLMLLALEAISTLEFNQYNPEQVFEHLFRKNLPLVVSAFSG